MENLVQEVAPDHDDAPNHDDDLAIHERICGSLIKIVCYNPPALVQQIGCVVTGVVVTSGDNFCHVIAFWGAVLRDENSSAFLFETILPDGTRMGLARPRPDVEIHSQSRLVAFTLPTLALVNPVTISPLKASQNDRVFAVGFRLQSGQEEPGLITSHRSRGFVTHARNSFFSHDCPPAVETYDGDPVFNEHEHFVGITYKDRGIAVALSIRYITKVLGMFHDGMEDQPLCAILQCIRDKAANAMIAQH